MKNPILSYVGWFLLFSALGFYGYGIITAIYLSWPPTPIKADYPTFLLTTISSIQALLLTNLGIVLGISIAKPESGLAKQMMLQRTAMTTPPDPIELREKIQLFGLIIYILSLIACLITWIVNGFSDKPEDVISLIPESGKMFVGVVLAYLTTVLNLPKK